MARSPARGDGETSSGDTWTSGRHTQVLRRVTPPCIRGLKVFERGA
jgi:hypothetical protein